MLIAPSPWDPERRQERYSVERPVRPPGDSPDPGGPSVNVWINSAASVFASVGTVFAFLLAARVYRRQVLQDRINQARRISARKESDHVVVHNGSDQPIFGVIVVFSDIALARYKPRVADTMEDQMDAGETRPFSSAYVLSTSLWHSVMHEVAFTDSAGIRWARHRAGPLREIEPMQLRHTSPARQTWRDKVRIRRLRRKANRYVPPGIHAGE